MVVRTHEPESMRRSRVTERRLSWVLVADSSHVQQWLKMTKCFLLVDKLAIFQLFFCRLSNSLQFLKDRAFLL